MSRNSKLYFPAGVALHTVVDFGEIWKPIAKILIICMYSDEMAAYVKTTTHNDVHMLQIQDCLVPNCVRQHPPITPACYSMYFKVFVVLVLKVFCWLLWMFIDNNKGEAGPRVRPRITTSRVHSDTMH